MKSPFKFLDAYTVADRDVFFGRDREIADLQQLTAQAPVTVLYGPSGVGKTSLVQCGLASRMDTGDWAPIFIRRREDINLTIHQEIQRIFQRNAQAEDVNLIDNLRSFFEDRLRPPYLIFDQFEELFILGSREEILQFTEIVRQIVYSNIFCKIILIIREEYLGHLYSMEEAIPELLGARLRVEPMNSIQVQDLLTNVLQFNNIRVEEPDVIIPTLIDHVRAGSSGVSLPYLQVYLDLLWQDMYQNAYPESNQGMKPPLNLTLSDIHRIGRIDDVLERFLREQELSLQEEMNKQFPEVTDRAVSQILDAFVTEEGTKRLIEFDRDAQGALLISGQIRKFFPRVPDNYISTVLAQLEQRRILRSSDQTIELANSSLATLIDQNRSVEQRRLNEIRQMIIYAYEVFRSTGDLMSRKQLVLIEDSLEKVQPFLSPEILDFIQENRRHLESMEGHALAEAHKNAAKDRRRRIMVSLMFIVSLLMLVLSLVFYWRAKIGS